MKLPLFSTILAMLLGHQVLIVLIVLDIILKILLVDLFFFSFVIFQFILPFPFKLFLQNVVNNFLSISNFYLHQFVTAASFLPAFRTAVRFSNAQVHTAVVTAVPAITAFGLTLAAARTTQAAREPAPILSMPSSSTTATQKHTQT